MIWISHGNLLLAVFFINRCLSYWWIEVVSWLNHLTLAIDLWGSSTQHLVRLTFKSTLDSSALLYIHCAASHGYPKDRCLENLFFLNLLGFTLVKVQPFLFYIFFNLLVLSCNWNLFFDCSDPQQLGVIYLCLNAPCFMQVISFRSSISTTD